MPTHRGVHIGLKLWSTNVHLAQNAQALYDQGVIDLIELYVVPETLDLAETWADLSVPFMMHCPHNAHGFNLAKSELREANAVKFAEVEQFADRLDASVIVTHGGNRGPLEEALSQAAALNSPRMFIENKPMRSLTGGLCVGHSPEQIGDFLRVGGAKGFVLDFGHATCAANSAGVDPFVYVADFANLGPKVFHIGDGHRSSEKDHHLDFGAGDFDLPRLLKFVPDGANLTIETPTDLSLGLEDFRKNIDTLRALLLAGLEAERVNTSASKDNV